MSLNTSKEGGHGRPEPIAPRDVESIEDENDLDLLPEHEILHRSLVRKIDLRLCTIAGILCSLNLIDSGIISSASVTTIFQDLDLGIGNRYVSLPNCYSGAAIDVEILQSISIMVYTIASVIFQLPATIAVRVIGPRIWFTFITISFGVITAVSPSVI
jgi:hypothetical protein